MFCFIGKRLINVNCMKFRLIRVLIDALVYSMSVISVRFFPYISLFRDGAQRAAEVTSSDDYEGLSANHSTTNTCVMDGVNNADMFPHCGSSCAYFTAFCPFSLQGGDAEICCTLSGQREADSMEAWRNKRWEGHSSGGAGVVTDSSQSVLHCSLPQAVSSVRPLSHSSPHSLTSEQHMLKWSEYGTVLP